MAHDPVCNPSQIRDDNLVLRLLDRLVKYKQQRRQHRNAADNAENNTLCHDNSKIHTKCKAHETQCHETSHRRDGASDHRCDRIRNRMRHRTFFISLKTPLLLFVTVPEENGIIHRHTQL